MTDLKFIRTLLEAVEAKEAEISIVYCKFQESGMSNILLHIDADSDTLIGSAIKKANEYFVETKQKQLQLFDTNNKDNQDIKQEKKLTFTYLMMDERSNYYKIGKSNNPIFREKTLQSEMPLIKLIAYCEEEIVTEKILHTLYEEKRIRGEWFKLSNQDVNKITKLMMRSKYCNLSVCNKPATIKKGDKSFQYSTINEALSKLFINEQFIPHQKVIKELAFSLNLCETTARRRIYEIIDNKTIIQNYKGQQCFLYRAQAQLGKQTIYELKPCMQ